MLVRWLTILALMAMQVLLFIHGCILIKRNFIDLCGYLDVLFFVFFSLPAWDIYFELGLFSHMTGVGFGGYAKSDILLFIFITTLMGVLFDVGYCACTRTVSLASMRGKNLRETETDNSFYGFSYAIVCAVLTLVWLIVIANEYKDYNGSFITFLLPARKQGIKSGIEGMIQILFPEILLLIVMIRNWDRPKWFRRILLPTMILLVSLSISAQRRDMIQGILLLGMVLLIRRMQRSSTAGTKKSENNRKLTMRYIALGALVIIMIPMLWYARNFATQLSRGEIARNPFSIRTFSELLFGSSCSGFDSFLIVEDFDKTYHIPYLYCIRYFISFWIPRRFYPGKTMQLTLLIKEVTEDKGNISLFYVNDLYFSFRWLAIAAAPMTGFVIAKNYVRAMQKKEITELIVGVYMFTQIVMLFKNGVAAYLTWMTAFIILYRALLFFCRRVNVRVGRRAQRR